MALPEYTVTDIQGLVSQLQAHFDSPATVGRPLIDEGRMVIFLLKQIRDLRQRVAALEQAP
ncbi:MAG TPA: hypothetical protein VJ890_15120 [Vineibacter sp.]|nr:hypothetical protein [Vineibacter sp.]